MQPPLVREFDPVMTVKEVAAQARPSVVVVKTASGLGSGFAVSGRQVLTAFHVIEGEQAITIEAQDGKPRVVVSVLAYDRAGDLALLAISGPTLPVLALGDSKFASPGQAVTVIGAPRGLESTGVVSAIRDLEGGLTLLQVTAPISGGSSGGPVLDDRARVLGVIRLYVKDGQQLNFATSAVSVRADWFRVSEPSRRDHESQQTLAAVASLSRQNQPRTRADAVRHVLEGLTRVIDACNVLGAHDEGGPFSQEQWHVLRMTCERIHLATTQADGKAFDALRAGLLTMRKDGVSPIGGASSRVQEKAREFATVIDRAKQTGLGNAILAVEGRKELEPTAPPTRAQVAVYLAIALSYVDGELPQPILKCAMTKGELERAILERMPMGGHGKQVDRTLKFTGEAFTEQPEKTVIAAFKAAGMPAGQADQLFKAALAKENRARGRARSKKPR